MCRFQSLTKLSISFLILSIFCLVGCRPQQPIFFGDTNRWQEHYIQKATDIEFPNVNVDALPEVFQTAAPLTLGNPDPEAMWDLTLEEAVHMALKNSKVLRTLSGVNFSPSGVMGTPGALLQSGVSAQTVYDPALIESDPRYGQEAALAAFDAQFNASAGWMRNNESPNFSDSDTGTFRAGISKYTAPGTQFWVNHTAEIERSPYYLENYYGSDYSASFDIGFNHPLLQGGGVEFNRISGPGASPGMYNGVAVARINTDITLTDFEMSTRTMVADVERAYWNLYYAFHRLESVRSGRDSAYETWHQTMVQAEIGALRGNTANLAQAEQNYFQFRLQTEVAQNNLFRAENALRYIMGLAPTDGRLIRPIDDPITAPIGLDWHSVRTEALFRSPDLRKTKWIVKQRELELTASKNFLLPRLDLDGGVRVRGWGPGAGLMGKGSGNVPWGTAYSEMGADNDHSAWLGLTASMPLGFRAEQAAVRNAQLNLQKAKAVLREQELELTHQLSDSFREISLAYQQIQTTLATYRSASSEVNAVRTSYEVGSATLDLLLQAQRRQAEAETGYYSAVVEYNLAIMTLHYRKGSLLEYNNICLAEGDWPAKAYFDAKRRARERDAGRYFDYGFTLPGVVSRGTYRQHQDSYNSVNYDSLPTSPREGRNGDDNRMMVPPSAAPNETLQFSESEGVSSIPLPMPTLQKTPMNAGTVERMDNTTPVSFTAPAASGTGVLTPPTTSPPTRNMRYVP